MLRRARAYEALGLLRKAHADVSLLLKVNPGNEEARLEERRLSAGISAASQAPPGQRKKAAAAALQAASKKKVDVTTRIKCQLGDDIRMVEVPGQASYNDIMTAVNAKFPGSGPLALKYK